ncbi:cytochrome P450, partial [Trifolium medium]|nr:cytochrome P450 [Trifolium medium]
MLWVLWNNRNNQVWNDTKEEGRSLGFKAWNLWNEWFLVQQHHNNNNAAVQQQHAFSWQKPSVGWQKCNVDAGFHRELNKTSAGWLLRDHSGLFVLEGTSWREGNCSIIEGEAIALLEAMREVEHRGITHVVFETDSKSVVDAIHNLRAGSSEFST